MVTVYESTEDMPKRGCPFLRLELPIRLVNGWDVWTVGGLPRVETKVG